MAEIEEETGEAGSKGAEEVTGKSQEVDKELYNVEIQGENQEEEVRLR